MWGTKYYFYTKKTGKYRKLRKKKIHRFIKGIKEENGISCGIKIQYIVILMNNHTYKIKKIS